MQPDPCPPAQEIRFLDASLRKVSPASAPVAGYSTVIATTALGLPVLPRWCVWIQPSTGVEPDRWELRWLTAVRSALTTWDRELSLIRVDSPARANVLIERRRPPRRRLPGGWRASNGSSQLQVAEVLRGRRWLLEPRVTVLVSPELRAPVLEATALHELGHAFGLWGHSPESGDAMAVSQGQVPVLQLTDRDRSTLRWVYGQRTRFGRPITPSGKNSETNP